MGDLGVGMYLLLLFTTFWFYNVLFEVFNHGATPGKLATGLRVMNANGTPVGWTGSIIRNLVRFVDTLPGCYAFGCIAVLVSRQFQRLGDLAAGTVVVHSPRKVPDKRSSDETPAPVTMPLTPDEQQAIVSFGERAGLLNSERADELAAILAPVLGDVDGRKMMGHANWILGDRGDS